MKKGSKESVNRKMNQLGLIGSNLGISFPIYEEVSQNSNDSEEYKSVSEDSDSPGIDDITGPLTSFKNLNAAINK